MAEYQGDLFDDVLSILIQEGNTEKESLAMMATLAENVGLLDRVKQAATMFRFMADPKKFPMAPPPGPVNLTNIFKGATKPPVQPNTFKIGTAGRPLTSTAASTGNKGGVLTQLATAASAALPAALGGSSNKTGEQPVQPPARPRGMSNIPPAEAQPGSPSYVEPKVEPVNRRRVVPPVKRPAAPVVARPKPTGPITSAQAIAMGSKEGQPSKSSVSTYRDAADKKGTSVGRYLTLAQHRQAVAARKAAEAEKGK